MKRMGCGRTMCPVAAAVILALCTAQNSAVAEEVEFNTDVLDVKDRGRIDLKQFSQAGYIMPGNYNLILRVNKSELQEQAVEFLAPDDNPDGSEACLTQEMVQQFGLKEKVLDQLTWWHNQQCLDIRSLKGMELRPDLGLGALNVNLPQAYLEYNADNWDPPSRWDQGIPGVLFDYNLNAQHSHQSQSGNSQYVSGSGTVGANFGAWRLRADLQGQYNRERSGSRHSWNWNRYYLYRAIASLQSKLMLGENYLSSGMFDSFRYTGAALESSDNMLPPNLRGYAPEVAGVAKTNATVTVRQQGRMIYETQVAAGPFRIQDLNSATSGTLDVTVREQDGSVQTFQVNTANVPYLTRPGLVRYKLALGKPSDSLHHAQGPKFITSEFSWGVNNGWSLYGGALLAGDYNAFSVGVGRDLLILGAISLDVTESEARLPEQGNKKGGSYRVSYSKHFDRIDSQITFAGYRFSERNFLNMSQFLEARYHHGNVLNGKELYSIMLNKQFREANISAYLNYSHQTYWDRPPNETWNLSVSHYFDFLKPQNLSLSVSAYRTRSQDTHDDGFYVGLSIPWSNGGTLDYSGQFGGEPTHSVGYYDRIDDNNNYRINVGTAAGGRKTSNAYFTHGGDIAEVNASASYSGGEYRALGISAQGGLTATADGAALHRVNSIGGTRMLVDTNGVSDVPVGGYGGISMTNTFGKAVVADVSSYYRSSVSIDMNRLPDTIEATRSVVQGTLTEGAIGYRKLGVIAGQKAMAILKLSDGSSPPFGATVVNKDNVQTGLVNDDGSVWLSGINPGESMKVEWNGQVQCSISLPSPLPADITQPLLLPCHKAAVVEP